MHPHTPPDRRSFESPDFGATTPTGRPDRATKDRPISVAAMLFAALVLAAIIALIVLL